MNKQIWLASFLALTVSSCATSSHKLTTEKSFLTGKDSNGSVESNRVDQSSEAKPELTEVVSHIKPIEFKKETKAADLPIVEQFSHQKMVKIASNELPLNDFIHYVMGEVLNVSYILGVEIKQDQSTLTLNLQESVSHYKLFSLVEELLAERNYKVNFNDGIYYINKEGEQKGKEAVVFGFGNKVKDVPNTANTIWQMVPFDYGFNGTLQLTLAQLAKVKVYPDSQQNLLMLRGKRGEIIKALEFFQLVDKPKLSQREIALYRSTFVDIQTLIERLTLLLQQEGISVGIGNEINKAVSIVPIANMGALTLFANEDLLIQRSLFWLKTIDQPEEGNNLQYFIYAPQFSRAADLGASLEALIGGSQSTSSSTSLEAENKKVKNTVSGTGIANANIGLVIDERANSLIFQTTGDEYRKLLPLIKRLDVMPKQIMLEAVIAEVKLTDEFKQGVDFSLTNKAASAVTGNFNLSSGDGGLSYVLTGADGKLDISLFQKNTNVNVLSRPSLLVRDGVTASLTVGDDIPTVGEIVTDPTNGSQTSIVYRRTGVELSVTPTINAQGVVIMEIEQKISNQAPGDATVEGSPTIFERTISTEVVADSGQTIVLGGLISKDRTVNERTTPFFSSIPIVGHLFSGEDDTETKTELVVLVTPKVLDSQDEWDFIKTQLSQKLNYIELED